MERCRFSCAACAQYLGALRMVTDSLKQNFLRHQNLDFARCTLLAGTFNCGPLWSPKYVRTAPRSQAEPRCQCRKDPHKGLAYRGQITFKPPLRGSIQLQPSATLRISPWRGGATILQPRKSDAHSYPRTFREVAAAERMRSATKRNAHPLCMPSCGAHTVTSHLALSLVAAQRRVN